MPVWSYYFADAATQAGHLRRLSVIAICLLTLLACASVSSAGRGETRLSAPQPVASTTYEWPTRGPQAGHLPLAGLASHR
jgi:hypothetical protein